MWGVLRYYNLLRVGVTWKGPEIIELWYNQCDSLKRPVTKTATQCYYYYGSSDSANGNDDDDYDNYSYDDGYDNNKQQHSNNDRTTAYSTRRNHQSANNTNNLNSATDIHNNSSGQRNNIHKSCVLRTTSMVRCPHRQTVLKNFTYNNGYSEATASDNDSISSDVDENDSLLGASEVNFISLVWHKFIYAT